MISPLFLHYFSIGIGITLATIGTGIGQGFGAFGALKGLSRQDLGSSEILRAMIIGLAVTESGVILALVLTLLNLMTNQANITYPIALAELGISLAISISATIVSFASSFALASSCKSISRQPFFSQKILTLMLLAQAIMEAPVIFTFIVCLIIKAYIVPDMNIYYGIKFFAASLCMCLGCIGPSLGQAIYSKVSCRAMGINKYAYNKVFSFSILNQAVIETPLIFCLLISIMIIYMPLSANNLLSSAICFLVAGLTAGVGSIFTSSSSGYVASKSCLGITRNPDNYAIIFRSTILVQAFIESCVIYALVVSLMLLNKSW